MAVRLAPFEAAELVDVNVRQRLTLVSLTPAEHAAALRTSASVGARGGAVYDVLLLAAARRCRADRIHTLNHRHFVAFAPDLVSCLRDRWRFVAPRRPLGKAGGRSLFVPRRKDDGRTTKRRGFLGATRRAAGLFASHVVARSLQTTSGLLVARALWDTKTPRGETPAISETRHEVIGWFRAMRVDGVGRTGLPWPFHPFREEIST